MESFGNKVNTIKLSRLTGDDMKTMQEISLQSYKLSGQLGKSHRQKTLQGD